MADSGLLLKPICVSLYSHQQLDEFVILLAYMNNTHHARLKPISPDDIILSSYSLKNVLTVENHWFDMWCW